MPPEQVTTPDEDGGEERSVNSADMSDAELSPMSESAGDTDSSYYSIHSSTSSKTTSTSADSLTVIMGSGNSKNKNRRIPTPVEPDYSTCKGKGRSLTAGNLSLMEMEQPFQKSESLFSGSLMSEVKTIPLQKPESLISGNMMLEEKQLQKPESLLTGSFVVTSSSPPQNTRSDETCTSPLNQISSRIIGAQADFLCGFCEHASFKTEHELMIHQMECAYNVRAPLAKIREDHGDCGSTLCDTKCSQNTPIEEQTVKKFPEQISSKKNNGVNSVKKVNEKGNGKKITTAQNYESPVKHHHGVTQKKKKEKGGFFSAMLRAFGCMKKESIMESVVIVSQVPNVPPIESPNESDGDDSTIDTLLNDDLTLDLTVETQVEFEPIERHSIDATLTDIDINIERFLDAGLDEGKSISVLWRGEVEFTSEVIMLDPKSNNIPSANIFKELFVPLVEEDSNEQQLCEKSNEQETSLEESPDEHLCEESISQNATPNENTAQEQLYKESNLQVTVSIQ